MLKQLAKDSAIYGIGRFAIIFLSFVTLPILTNHLSVAEYGLVDLLVLCVTLLNLTVALEISQAVARFIGEAEEKKDKVSYTSTALFFSIAMYGAAAILIAIFHREISQILFGTEENGIFIIFLIPWFILHGLNYFITNQLRWENKAFPYVGLKVLNSVLLLLAIILLLQKNGLGVNGVLYSYIFSLAVTAVIGFAALIRFKSLHLSFCKVKLKEMLAFSFPLVPSSAAVFAQSYIDRIMIAKMLDLNSLGLYSLAFKIASVLTLVSMAFQISITPLIYQTYKNKEAPAQISQSFNVYLFSVFSMAIGICLFLPELFHFFIGESFKGSASLVPILCLSVLLSGVSVFAPGMSIAKKTKLLAIINIIGMFLNIILNVVCIKYFGLMGAAIATFASMAIVLLLTFAMSAKYYAIPYSYKRILLGAMVTIASLIWIYAYQDMDIFSFSITAFCTKIVLFVIIALSLLGIFRKKLI